MIYNMDVLDFLHACSPYHTMFADPPDNLGLEYDGFADRVPPAAYYGWLEAVVLGALRKCNVFWLSYYHAHDLKVSAIMDSVLRLRHPAWSWRKIIWRFTFGQYRDRELPNGFRPILLLTGPGTTLNLDAIRVPSVRQIMGDSRAAGLRVPDDVWDFARVVGNARERRAWHPTQHPEELMDRVIRVSGPGRFVDLFGGTGTSLRVGGANMEVVEQSTEYCARMAAETGHTITQGF